MRKGEISGKPEEAKTNLGRVRRKKGLTQHELAKLSGVKESAIRQYEIKYSNINNSSVKTVRALAKALQCNIEEILNDED